MNEITGSCHCGAVQITLPQPPDEVFECNCSLCSRVGWIGGYYPISKVIITEANECLSAYVQGHKTIKVWHCKTCGCTTHWTPNSPADDDSQIGVNMRMFTRSDWSDAEHRQVDGASR